MPAPRSWPCLALAAPLLTVGTAAAAAGVLDAGDPGRGTLTVEAGTLGVLHRYARTPDLDRGVGLAFLQLKYRSAEQRDWAWGGWWFGLKPLWEQERGDFDAISVIDHDLRELHGSLRLPGTATRLKAGRFDLSGTVLDGNAHQGVDLVSEDLPGLRFQGGFIRRWAKYDRVHMNFQGMTGWDDAGDTHPRAGANFWFASLRVDLGATGHLEPFARHQDGIMSVQGLDWDLGMTLPSGQRLGFDGTLARYANRWPRSLRPDYETVHSWLLHGYRQFGGLRIGLGWHGVNDRRGDLGAGLFDWIDPLIVDETIPYDDRNDAQLYYADARLERGGLDLQVRYGHGVNAAMGVDSHEINLVVKQALTPALTLGGFVAVNRYTGDALPDYARVGAILTYAY